MGNITKEELARREKLIRDAYAINPNLFKISEMIGMEYASVRAYAKKFGLKNVRASNIIWVDAETVQCSKCSKHVLYSELGVIRPNKPNRATLSYCRECRTKQIIKNNKSSLDSYLKNRIRGVKTRAKNHNTPFLLSLDYLKKIYERQNGKCFYTGVEMEIPLNGKELKEERHRLSIDKVIPELGYVEGNIVLCTKRANSIKGVCSLEEMKEWLPVWYYKLVADSNYEIY